MPRRTPITVVALNGWRGGLNRDTDPSMLSLEETPDCLNVDFGPNGEVSRRNGYAEWDATPDEACRALISWEKQGGNEHLVYVGTTTGQIWSGTSSPLTEQVGTTLGTWGTTPRRDYPVATAAYNIKLYVTSRETTTPLRYNGTTWTALTRSDFDGTGSRYPAAAHTCVHADRVWAGNVKDTSGNYYRYRIYYSDIGDAETWQASNYIDIDLDADNEIMGLVPFGESLVVFKDHSIHMIVGRSETSFTVYAIDRKVGCTSPGTIQVLGGHLYFWDKDTGFWRFDGSSLEQLDADRVFHYIRDGINYTQEYRARGFIHENRYYLSVAWGSDTYPSRTFVLDLLTGAWTEYDYGYPAAVAFTGSPKIASADNDTKIHTLNSGTTDDGTAISCYFTTPWITPEGLEARKFRLRRLDMVFDSLGDIDITAAMYRDYNTGSAVVSQTVDTYAGAGVTASNVLERTTGWGGYRWRTVQFKFSSNSSAADFQLSRLGLVISGLGRVRGEP